MARRTLSSDEVSMILRHDLDEALTEARRYDHLGRDDAAQQLRREAEVLRTYL